MDVNYRGKDGRRRSWKINRKHAAPIREIAHIELASIHLDAMTGDTQAQAHAGPIVASLLE